MNASVTIPLEDFQDLMRCRDCVEELFATAYASVGTYISWVGFTTEGVVKKYYPERYQELEAKLLPQKEENDGE